MKTLESYNLIKDFLASQGISPTTAMLCVSDSEWADLVLLAQEWRTDMDALMEKERAETDAMSDEELRQRDMAAKEAARLEEEELMYASCGHEPNEDDIRT